MSSVIPLLLAIGLGLAGWLVARARAWRFRKDAPRGKIPSLPIYHAWYAGLWIGLPMLAFAALWRGISGNLVLQHVLSSPDASGLPPFGLRRDAILDEARAVAMGLADRALIPEAQPLVEPFREALALYNWVGVVVALLLGLVGAAWAFTRLKPNFAARSRIESGVLVVLFIASTVAILTTLGIFGTLVFETVRFFGMVSPVDFLLGTHWGPDPMSMTPDPDRYGSIPLFWGTIFIGAIIAMIVAIPLGLMSAIYLTQYASPQARKWIKPALEILAGVPTVVYGYFAALTVAPAVRDFAISIGISNASSESALAAGMVMGIMIIPLVSSLADDSISAVPQAMRDGSLAMGATTNETIRRVLIPAALPGIVAGVMLAISRAIGETMIVVMAAGAAANLTANPFEAMTTVTFQIVAMLTGEASLESPATLSAFALGFVLFMITLALNVIALRVVKRFREAYE